MFVTTLILTLIIVSVAFAGIALRVLLVKGGEFKGTCATNNPMLKNEIGECKVCGAKPEEDCKEND
ncbi:MAG TPA: membrane or secreted protein [Chromatiaceae bacterium]|nr:membrane or secreted protein [Chromatiaceae bacterium]